MTVNRENLAWAAGLFEGEGCFSIGTDRIRGSLAVSIRSTDKDVIEKFHSIVSVGKVYGPYFPPKGKTRDRKPQYQWSAQSFEHFQYIGALLWPWLHKRRQSRFVEVLKTAINFSPKPKKLIRNKKILEALKSGELSNQVASRFLISKAMVSRIKNGS